ncbi:MAG: metallophosphatase family protein [Archaeoglobaceae archaeon]|nr:metallophosphatase family protein [Archaeoglobaceae archaeon]
MRLVVVSDTHLQKLQIPEKLLKSADIVVHTGDFVSYELYQAFSEFNLVAVRGDNDDLDRYKVLCCSADFLLIWR